MGQFDIYRIGETGRLAVDIQSDLLAHLATRVMVPLIPAELAPQRARNLNPVLDFDAQAYVLQPQFAATFSMRELGIPIGHARANRDDIVRALDVLITGV